MKIKNSQNRSDATVFLIPCFETDAKSIVGISFQDISIASKVFYGKKDTHYCVYENDKTYLFIGIGKEPSYKELQNNFRRIASKNKALFTSKLAFHVLESFTNEQVEAIIVGLNLGTYELGHYKKQDKHPFLETNFELHLLTNKAYDAVVDRAVKIASAQLETFKLVDLPPNKVTPTYLANWAIESGEANGFTTTVLNLQACKSKGLAAFLAVGQGSIEEPQFVIMEYGPKKMNATTKHVGLVGKGITFDTGGLNIKTAGMVHMKCDMGGGAAVFGAMQLIAALNVDIKVTAIVPCCENAVDSKAFKPSDVINSYSGSTIEIIDTDAEGRLILADGLSYLIKNYKPDTIIDIATLTGSSVGTFGYECAALFSKNSILTALIQKVGDEIGERSWPLPLWDSYHSDIESEIADVKNYSGKPVAGAISAAKFLEHFTEKHPAWAHLDIAGVAFGDDEFAKTKHATGFGVYLLTKLIENLN